MGAVLDLVRVLFEPTAVFERVREKPRFLAPFVALAIIVVLTMRGTEQISGMEDLQPALGLDLLAPGAKGLTLALLRGINPFSLYGVFLTATGITVTHKTSKGSAYTAAIVQLLVTLLVTGVLTGMRGGR